MEQSHFESKKVPGYWELYKSLCANCLRGYQVSVLGRLREADLDSGGVVGSKRQGLVWEYLFAWLTMLQQIPVILVLSVGIPLTTILFIATPLINLVALPLARYHLVCQRREIEKRIELELQFRAEQLRRKSRKRKPSDE